MKSTSRKRVLAKNNKYSTSGPILGKVQRKENASSPFFSPTSSFSQSLSSTGQSLPSSAQQFFKARMGRDFSHVKIHTTKEAASAADDLNADAFTIGNHIAFAEEAYDPASTKGKRLLAHELTHVIHHQTQTSSVDQVYLQRRGRGRIRRRSTDALVDALMQPQSPLWRQLNPDASSPVNCPATAAAVDEYLGTGRISPAPAGDALSHFVFSTRSMSPRINHFRDIRRMLRARNSFAVVRATRSSDYLTANPGITPEHFFTALNYHGDVVLIDAYGTGSVITDVDTFLSQQGFEFYNIFRGEFRVEHRSFDSTVLPDD